MKVDIHAARFLHLSICLVGQVDIDPLIVNRHHFPTAGRVALQDTPVVGLLLMIRGVGASLLFV